MSVQLLKYSLHYLLYESMHYIISWEPLWVYPAYGIVQCLITEGKVQVSLLLILYIEMHEEDRGLSLDFVISIATVLVGSRAADNNLSIEVQWIALLLGSKVRA